MATPEEIETFKRDGANVVAEGERWFKKIEETLKAKHPGDHTVVINVDDGTYVVAATRLDAVLAAEKQFPTGARGYVRGIAVRSNIDFDGCPKTEQSDARPY